MFVIAAHMADWETRYLEGVVGLVPVEVQIFLCAYKENKRSNETVNKCCCRAIYSCFTEDGLSEK